MIHTITHRIPVERILFIYARDGMVQCLTLDEAARSGTQLKKEGWKHTVTIDPARWIEALSNSPTLNGDKNLLQELTKGIHTYSDNL